MLPRVLILAEARDTTLNNQLELAWANICIAGTHYLKAASITGCIDSLSLRTKQDKLAGLEIADAIVIPIARTILGKKTRIDYEIIKTKMRKSSAGEIKGHGLVVLPKK